MKLPLVLLLFAFTFISSHDMIDKLVENDPYQKKKSTLKIIGDLLFDSNFEATFIAGILSNVYHGKDIGKFETSIYTNPEDKPDYIEYMDKYHDYRKKYSDKIITEVAMPDLEKLLEKLEKEKWQKGQFGLGCLQWRGIRTYQLFKVYKMQCSNCMNIKLTQATRSEGKMIVSELTDKDKFAKVHNEWRDKNPEAYGSKAAYEAGYILSKKYVSPAYTDQKAKKIAETAKNMYTIMNS